MRDRNVIAVVLADEHALVREAVRTVLSAERDLEVVAEARDGAQAIDEVERVHPDVALLDADLPNGDGIRATAEIVQRFPSCRVLVISGSEDEDVLFEAVEAGAMGYLSKSSPIAELIAATRTVHRGEALIPPHLLPRLLRRLVRRGQDLDDAGRRFADLTRREREVLVLVAEGADNDTIAQRLVISPQTARTHVSNLLGKLDVHSRLEAAALVRRNGMFEELRAGGAVSREPWRFQDAPRHENGSPLSISTRA